MKLHLGCGKRKIHGWVNIDIDPNVNPDVVENTGKLESIKDGSVDVIYACHVLEHFKRKDTLTALKVWNSKLKSGGILRVAVPDFGAVVTAYAFHCGNYPLSTLLGFLVGGQRNKYDNHHMVFDYELLSEYLKKAEFENIKKFDWKDTDHFFVDDYSQCYLPHLDKGSGLLMSLNVECTKK